ncbi:MAG: hypothetical protein JSV86_04960 [Gemmatimonadota bacterium]|nr:MAG: hypothetical protein JSV86_04960 [Gemmatimonadota bacterium]
MQLSWNDQWRRARQLVLVSRQASRDGDQRKARRAANLAWKQAQYAISRAYRTGAVVAVA